MNLYNLTCAWCFIANSTLLNIEWPDGNSQYYGTIVNSSLLKINGHFPNSRYFSFELYDLKTWEPFWDIYDKNINAELNPFEDSSISYNDSLKYHIHIDTNNNIKDKKYIEENEYYLLIYRIYVGINETGGVNLPRVSILINNQWKEITQCNENERPVISIQDTTPIYSLYKPNEKDNFYPPQNKSNLFINYDARYMIAFYNNTQNTFTGAKIQLTLPIYSTNMENTANNNYETRYYSISVVDLSSPRQTTQTIGDITLSNNSTNTGEDICLYLFCHNLENISIQLFPPSTNDHNCTKKIQYFGVLYRQLLPQFKNEIPDTPNLNQDGLKKIMENYYPKITWF